jgi:hypothetical protein
VKLRARNALFEQDEARIGYSIEAGNEKCDGNGEW